MKTILNDIIELIQFYEQYKTLQGYEKKEKVIKHIKESKKYDEKLYDIINEFIDIVVSISKNKIRIKKLKKKNCIIV